MPILSLNNWLLLTTLSLSFCFSDEIIQEKVQIIFLLFLSRCFICSPCTLSLTINDHLPQLPHSYYYTFPSYSLSFPSDVCHRHMLLNFSPCFIPCMYFLKTPNLGPLSQISNIRINWGNKSYATDISCKVC